MSDRERELSKTLASDKLRRELKDESFVSFTLAGVVFTMMEQPMSSPCSCKLTLTLTAVSL